MPAKNDNAVLKTHRSVWFAGKPGSYRTLSSRPRNNMFGMAIAAAKPSSDTAALIISKCRKVSSNSARKAFGASPGAAFRPSSKTLPE
ncbi:hypothetical protein D3C79_987480 [compost metagenome]